MRKTIKATTIAICALVITLFAASCSKDNIFLTQKRLRNKRSTTWSVPITAL